MPEETDVKEPKVQFSGKAAEDLLKYRFNTDEEHLPEMTRVSSREAWMMAGIKTINEGREYTAKLAQFNEYLYKLKLYETYPARLEKYKDFEKRLKEWIEKEHPKPPAEVFYPGEQPRKPRPFLTVIPFMLAIYEKKVVMYEAWDEKNRLYEKYLIDYAAWELKVRKPDPVINPGVKPAKPKVVEKPVPFFFSDRFNYWLMKYKRSIGGAGVDSVDKMTETAIQTDVPGDEFDEVREGG